MRSLLFPLFALLFAPQAQAQAQDDSTPESPKKVVTNLHENGCPRLPQAIRAINEALNEAMLDEAVKLADQAAKAILCQPEPINPLALTGVFHMKGAVHTFRGETAAARDAFEWSVSVSPLATLDPILGDKAQRAFQEIHTELIERHGGRLQLSGQSKVWVDGRVVPTNTLIELPSGPHLLQWQNPGEAVQARAIEIAPGETRTLPVGTQAGAGESPGVADAAALPDPAMLAARRRIYMGSGSGLVAVGGLMLKQGLNLRDQIADGEFENPNDLNKKADNANALGGMGIGTAVLGVGVLGIGFVTTSPTHALSVQGSF